MVLIRLDSWFELNGIGRTMNDEDKTAKVSDQQPETEKDPVIAGAEPAANDPNLSRRRALLAGLAAAPVVLTLMNRSAWAATANCSTNTVNSFNNAGNVLTASFQRSHPTATINAGGQLKC